MVKISEIEDEKETTRPQLFDWKLIWHETVDWSLTVVDWSVAGFMGLGKVMWWGTALLLILGLPAIKVANTGALMEEELREMEMNRQVHEKSQDLGMMGLSGLGGAGGAYSSQIL